MDANKLDYKQIILRVALFVAMLGCGFVSVFQSFNLLITYDYGIDMAGMYQTIKWFMPPIVAIIYYFLYRVYIGLMRSALNARMSMFGRMIATDNLRAMVDPLMICLALYVALVEVIFMLFPLYKNVFFVIVKEIGVAIFAYCLYLRLNKNLDKIFRPVIFWGLQLALVVLVVLV